MEGWMDGWEGGQWSSERAHGTKKAAKDKKDSGTLRGTDRRSCNSTVLYMDWYVHLQRA